MPTLTRAQLEKLLVDACGPWMAKATMDATTVDGTNPSLNGPIRYALSVMGYAVADVTNVADSDLSTILADDALDELLDRSRLATFKAVQGRIAKVTVLVEGLQSSNSDLMRAIAAIVAQEESAVARSWGAAGGAVSAGRIALGSQQTLDCNPWGD